MAKKKTSRPARATVSSLKPHLKRSLKQARALRGKVAKPAELDDLISHLQTLQATAQSNCPTDTWMRKFALAAKPAKKTSRKTAKKR